MNLNTLGDDQIIYYIFLSWCAKSGTNELEKCENR